MDPETSQGAGPQVAPQSVAETPAAQAANAASKHAFDDSFSGFGEHSSFNTALALTWMVALFSVLATLFFWWMNKSESDALADKKTEKDSLAQQISSPGSVEIENKAQDFKLSVKQLKTAYNEKYSFTSFLTDLNSKLTKDVQLSTIAVTADGSLNINGTTKGYRAVADLMMSLKSWSTLSNVDLLSVANTTTDDKMETVFAISAKVDKQKQKAAEAKSTGSTSGIGTTEGGNNEAIQ